MKVTVFGATGVVGSALLPLLAADHELVAVSRSTHATGQGVRWVEGDANSADDVARAIEGAEVVDCLVHSLGRRDFERQDRVAAENVAAACELARVKQIVYLGGLGDDDPTASPRREAGARRGSASPPERFRLRRCAPR